MYITLTNDFHNSAVRLRAKKARCPDEFGWLSLAQGRHAQDALCGFSECDCALGPCGERPKQMECDGESYSIPMDSIPMDGNQ